MRGDDAYAVLGLRPGAERAEIEQAYRRLIKRYHPDYSNGDARRAAELNDAYSLLRAQRRDVPRYSSPPPRHPPALQRQFSNRPQSKWFALILVGAVVAAGVYAARIPTRTGAGSSWPQFSATGPVLAGNAATRLPRDTFVLDDPLAEGLIESSVSDAMRLHADGAVMAAEFSQQCLRRLGASPSVALFDSCAAFDEAVTILANGNASFESGPFNPSAVTARQVGAARLLSADYFEAESRLQQIRSRVHMVLLPRISGGIRVSEAPRAARVPEPAIVDVPRIEPREVARRTANRANARPVSAARPIAGPAATRTAILRAQPPARVQPQPRSAPDSPAPRASAPAAESRKPPAWQQPIKPAWQQPLRGTSE